MSTLGGFQWGLKVNEKTPRNELHKVNKPGKLHSHLHHPRVMNKRRFEDESVKYRGPPRISAINKRAKHPIIKGEYLPINRLIETLNRPSINNLLSDLVKIHPQISKTIYDLQPKIDMQDAMSILTQKFDSISENLPYKGDVENDYSYLRIKPYLNEFLNCLSDFILNYLPPVELNILNSLTFIDFVTNMIIKLPEFSNNEYKYIKLKCFEQVSNTWLIILNNLWENDPSGTNMTSHEVANSNLNDTTEEDDHEVNQENLFNFIKIINDLNLKEKLQMYNQPLMNKFDKVLSFINNKSDLFNSVSNVNNGLNELITVDYSKYSLTANSST